MSRVKDIAVKCFRDEAQAILDLIPQWMNILMQRWI